MNTKTILIPILFFMPIWIYSQSFSNQILNKGPFQSSTSLTQDYDNDGDLDIILSRSNPAGIYWLENEASKQFPARPIITEDLSFYISDIDAADLDRDGDIDYVVCFTTGEGELAWFERLEDGTYEKWTIVTNKDHLEAEVADFNNDGLIDIATVGLGTNRTCKVYFNQGNFFFTESIIAENAIEHLDIGDWDNDGDIDIVVTGIGSVNTNTGEVTGSRVLINDGAGNFITGKWLWGDWFFTTSLFGGIEMVDLNGDGIQDVLGFGTAADAGLVFYDGTNLGEFNTIRGYEIDNDRETMFSDTGGDIITFDVDQNGFLDIIRQNELENRLVILYQFPGLEFKRAYLDLHWNTCCLPNAKMSIGDLDNDGDIDLVFPEQGNVDEDVSWYENIDGKLYKHQIYGRLIGVNEVKLADWDNDGDLDVFATVSSDQNLSQLAYEDEIILYENLDGTNFVNWRLNDSIDYAYDLEPADIDGDGDLDLFATASDADDLIWLRNDGFQADWVKDTIFQEANEPRGIAAGDLDGDGDQDVAVCSWNDNKIFGFRNDGTGNFSPFVIDRDIDGPHEIVAGDLDNDGDLDLAAVSTEIRNSVTIYINDGAGTFIREILYTGVNAQSIDLGDWNNDGQMDIFAGFIKDDVQIMGFIANEGTFEQQDFSDLDEDVYSVNLSDLDNDGDLDLLVGYDRFFTVDSATVIAYYAENAEIVNRLDLNNAPTAIITSITTGDVNNDGAIDIVYADFWGDNIALLASSPDKCTVLPAIDLGRDTSIQDGQILVLDASGEGFTYQWSTEETTPTIFVGKAGTYSVTVTDPNGCLASDTITIGMLSTSTLEAQLSQQVQFHPNPVKKLLTIEYENMPSFQVAIFDYSGKALQTFFSQEEGTGSRQISLPELPAGLYLLRFQGDFGVFHKRLLISR